MIHFMNIQSFSVVVPNKACANKCPFCVSRMVKSDVYPNKMDVNDPHYDINVKEYLKRMKYVANLGCNTIMLTGTSEPQQNKQFLATFALLHQQLGSPFTNIEMQTTGLFLTGNRDYLRFLRNFVGVNTIALSVNALSDDVNNEILGHGLKDKNIKLLELCELLKEYDFNVRMCYNLNDTFNTAYALHNIMQHAKDCHANQVTLRKLYASDETTPQGKWIAEHKLESIYSNVLSEKLAQCFVIGHTPYGAPMRNCDGICIVYDDDCMGKKPTSDVLKYLILRPNCKLYSSWDTPASLIF